MGGNDKRWDRAAAHHILQRRGDPFNKTMERPQRSRSLHADQVKASQNLIRPWIADI
jgi:hypothetical protein